MLQSERMAIPKCWYSRDRYKDTCTGKSRGHKHRGMPMWNLGLQNGQFSFGYLLFLGLNAKHLLAPFMPAYVYEN